MRVNYFFFALICVLMLGKNIVLAAESGNGKSAGSRPAPVLTQECSPRYGGKLNCQYYLKYPDEDNQFNSYYMLMRNPRRMKKKTDAEVTGKVLMDYECQKDPSKCQADMSPGTDKQKDQDKVNPFTNEKPEQPKAAPFTSRPTNGKYIGLFGGIGIPSVGTLQGYELRPVSAINTFTEWQRYNTYDAEKKYNIGYEVGLRVGRQFSRVFRADINFSYLSISGAISKVATNVTENPGSNFTLPKNYANLNLWQFTLNGYVDLLKNEKIWPTVGINGGLALASGPDLSLSYLPTYGLYGGLNWMIANNTIVSLGYRYNIIEGTITVDKNIKDTNGVLNDERSTRSNELDINQLGLHRIELSIRLMIP